ncbi:MAG: 4Fe-4S cluster-binding domain-containing protein [Syntrophales bacterium]|jgi:pyruvate formate-lyase activating enzyme-like uncharacterized protein|nr:4Fe-4S cluster-binding domain-containing protein [Syntrophales bacterium]MDY0043198.1 4Fe-4S cluster-binding domain-containing protein [Syntrophales bacterium]
MKTSIEDGKAPVQAAAEINESAERESNIEKNRSEYKNTYNQLKWIKPDETERAEVLRSELMKTLISCGALLSHGDSKLDVRRLSPGCRACGNGKWSCLFVNGICNMNCFYCPAEQNSEDVPQTNTVSFSDSRDYADYVERLGFEGVSMSGGEPLLTYEKTLRFVGSVRKRMGDRVYIWMYTNGTLATKERLSALHAEGVDEVRFDIGAIGYRLKPVILAAGIFDAVTVEIPAIPEDLKTLCELAGTLKNAGVGYLNLHQLRLTPYNFDALQKRNYTFLHGPKVTVLESELTALQVMHHIFEKKIDLPVNYCSFIYKNMYQKAAARRRGAEMIKKPYEDLTRTGLIRNISVRGETEKLAACVRVLDTLPSKKDLWAFGASRDRLYIHSSLMEHMDCAELSLLVRYDVTAIKQAISYRYVFKEVELNKRKRIYIERMPLGPEIELKKGEIEAFRQAFINEDPEGKDVSSAREDMKKGVWNTIFALQRFEIHKKGLADYY